MSSSNNVQQIDPSLKLGFVGAGNMATAIIEGILKSNLCTPSQLYISHPSAAKSKKYGHLNIENESADNNSVVQNSDIIILCVKPQILEKVCEQLRNSIDLNRHFVVSICAGVKLDKLTRYLLGESAPGSSRLRLARCTLNTAALIGSSCAAYSQNGNVTEADKTALTGLLSSVGLCLGEIKDVDVDAAMAVSSSGIAYMYMMADAMADGGVKMGLSRDVALRLSMQTMRGAAELMLKQHGVKHPMQLKDEVCSPGGMTIQGVHELERNGFRNAVICAIEGATNRARQL
jgi:pyrroline-5-carboxylate reductase